MSPTQLSDYEYAQEHFGMMLGCPQCFAEKHLAATKGDGITGWRLMCYDVLFRQKHECKAARAALEGE